jgi:hypothetical protein
MFNNFLFPSFRKSCCLWDSMETNIVQQGRSQNTKWRMRIACWTPKTTNTHSGYVIIITFPPQQWLRERSSVLCYTYIDCLVDSDCRFQNLNTAYNECFIGFHFV